MDLVLLGGFPVFLRLEEVGELVLEAGADLALVGEEGEEDLEPVRDILRRCIVMARGFLLGEVGTVSAFLLRICILVAFVVAVVVYCALFPLFNSAICDRWSLVDEFG